MSMLSELSHLQEAMDQLEKHTAEPYSLPPASEQVSYLFTPRMRHLWHRHKFERHR